MIQIINGFISYKGKMYDNKSGPIELPEASEKRLVEHGTAKYVGFVSASNAAPAGENSAAAACVNTSEQNRPAEAPPAPLDGIALDNCITFDENGHMTAESLMQMTRTNMEALAEDLGLDVKKCKNKAEIASLLAQVEIDLAAQDGEIPVPGVAMPS